MRTGTEGEMKESNPKMIIAAIRVVHVGLMITLVSFAAVTIYIMESNTLPAQNNAIFRYLPIAALIIVYPLSAYIFTKNVKKIQKQTIDLKSKLMRYQAAHIIRCGILEIAAILGLVISMITGTSLNFIVWAVVMVVFVMQFPTTNSIASRISATKEEVEILKGL